MSARRLQEVGCAPADRAGRGALRDDSGEQVDALKTGEGLTVIAPFLPSPLIEKLGSEGFRSRVERQFGGGWTVHFWRED